MLKNKLNFKSMIIGLIVGISISASTIALAAPQQIEVLYDNIKILVNGKEIAMDEQPFIKNGRTFVPLRFISEAFGAEVTWNETTSTVNVNSVSGSVYNTTPIVTPTPSVNVNTTVTTPTPTVTPNTPITTTTINNSIFGHTVQKDGYIIYVENGMEYFLSVNMVLHSDLFPFGFLLNETDNSFDFIYTPENKEEQHKILLKNVPMIKTSGGDGIKYEYFKTTILPLIKTTK